MVSPDTALGHGPIAPDASQGRGAGSPISLRFDAAGEPLTVKSVLAIPYEVWALGGGAYLGLNVWKNRLVAAVYDRRSCVLK
jgi:hypothetical protein